MKTKKNKKTHPAETLYKKQGRRYKPVGPEFIGFPADGIWLVEKNIDSFRLFMRLGDTPTVMTLAAFERHRDRIAEAARTAASQPRWSWNDVATAIIRAVAEEEANESLN